MSDAPLVGGSPTMLTFGDKDYELHPLYLKDWGQLERLALQAYKRDLLDTYTENMHRVPDEDKQATLATAFEKAAGVGLDSMAPKKLEDGSEMEYAIWWASATFDGRLSMIWLSMRRSQPDLTIEQVSEIVGKAGMDQMKQAADTVGDLSIPQVGNSESPRDQTTTASEG